MNKIILILSLSNLDEEQVSYYENLVNEIKQTYANEIDVLLTLNSMQIFNGNFHTKNTKMKFMNSVVLVQTFYLKNTKVFIVTKQ